MSRHLRFGVIGWPLGHTLSPAFQQAALDALGVSAVYEALPTPPEDLEARLGEARRGEWRGLNVTIPHKLRVAELVNSRTPAAERLEAVNTVDARDGRLIGDNTDVEGFARALTEHGGFDPRGQHAVLVGAGGAGRAVAWALADLGVERLTLANRRRDRADALATALTGQPITVTSCGLDDPSLRHELRGAALLVNATSPGHGGRTQPSGHAAAAGVAARRDSSSATSCTVPRKRPCWPRRGPPAVASSVAWRCWSCKAPPASSGGWVDRRPWGTMMEAARHALSASGA